MLAAQVILVRADGQLLLTSVHNNRQEGWQTLHNNDSRSNGEPDKLAQFIRAKNSHSAERIARAKMQHTSAIVDSMRSKQAKFDERLTIVNHDICRMHDYTIAKQSAQHTANLTVEVVPLVSMRNGRADKYGGVRVIVRPTCKAGALCIHHSIVILLQRLVS